jgi:hypothetical protein
MLAKKLGLARLSPTARGTFRPLWASPPLPGILSRLPSPLLLPNILWRGTLLRVTDPRSAALNQKKNLERMPFFGRLTAVPNPSRVGFCFGGTFFVPPFNLVFGLNWVM